MNPRQPLQTALSDTLSALDRALEQRRDHPHTYEVGVVTQIGQGIAKVRGLPGVKADELLEFPGDLLGMAFTLSADEIGVILLGESDHIASGDEVHRTQRVMDVPVGTELLGRVIDATGRPLDDRGRLVTWKRYPVERPAPPIMHRAPVTVPMQTGIKSVDALVPVGRGQRELIMGDRQTGKTAVAIDTIINQSDTDVICIYCAVGQRSSSTAKVIDDLEQYGAMPYCVVVVASGEDPPGLQFIAPYAATSIGEHFMADGRDVLVVYDDLTAHANAYRELSLLLRRPPGREAYPGDVFYIHSRLLERSTHLRSDHGGGSLTALPIVETEAQNISAYIPTNLISITDGQIYLSPELFRKGMLPAVDVGLSVSRVGGRTQLPAYRAVSADLRLAYSQFEELEVFARFGAQLDQETEYKLEHGRRVRETLKQPQYAPMPVEEQIAVLSAVSRGVFDDIAVSEVERAARRVARGVTSELPEICQRMRRGEQLTEDDLEGIETVARRYVYIIGDESENADH